MEVTPDPRAQTCKKSTLRQIFLFEAEYLELSFAVTWFVFKNAVLASVFIDLGSTRIYETATHQLVKEMRASLVIYFKHRSNFK